MKKIVLLLMVSLLCACSANTKKSKQKQTQRIPTVRMSQIKAVPAALMKVQI